LIFSRLECSQRRLAATNAVWQGLQGSEIENEFFSYEKTIIKKKLHSLKSLINLRTVRLYKHRRDH
jgi:hypothetical protein